MDILHVRARKALRELECNGKYLVAIVIHPSLKRASQNLEICRLRKFQER